VFRPVVCNKYARKWLGGAGNTGDSQLRVKRHEAQAVVVILNKIFFLRQTYFLPIPKR